MPSKCSQKIIQDRDEDKLDLIHRIQDHLTKKFQVYCGKDNVGLEYETIEEFWRYEGFFCQHQDADADADSDENKTTTTTTTTAPTPQWYNTSHSYWETEENVKPTIDGMLGGFAVLSDRDLAASRTFIDKVLASIPILKDRIDNDASSRSCECGAGIGRLTKGLMLPLGIQGCDLVETSPRLINAAPDYIGEHDASRCRFICEGLQDFHPEPNTYDIIWIQWVIGYLNDWDLCNFLHRMGKALRKGGVVVIKDNTCNELAFMSDKGDSDITRSYQYLMALVKESGLKVVKSNSGDDMINWQEDFPDDIWPVPMIALTM